MATKTKTWDAARVYQALRERYEEKSWALLTEVRNATGFPGQLRSADALAQSLWPSRGLDLHGLK